MEIWNGEVLSRWLGNLFFIEGYWEWVEEVLDWHDGFLKRCKLYEVIFASLFSCAYHTSIIKVFCECWYPNINILHTSIAEVSISLWDLYPLLGYPLLNLFTTRYYQVQKSYLMIQKVLTFTKLSTLVPCIWLNLL